MLKLRSLFLTATLLASSSVQSSLYFSGLYGSVGAGAIWTKGKHKLKDPDQGNSQQKLSNLGGLTSFHLGYITEKGVSTVMMGGEAYVMKAFHNIRKAMTFEDGSKVGVVNIHHNVAYGFGLILGKLINPKIMAYGKVSFELGTLAFKYKELTFGTMPNWDKNRNYKKIIPMAGFRYAVSDHFHVGFEYGLALLGKMKVRNAADNTDGSSREIEAKIMDNRFLITFTYQITAPKGNS